MILVKIFNCNSIMYNLIKGWKSSGNNHGKMENQPLIIQFDEVEDFLFYIINKNYAPLCYINIIFYLI